MTKNAAILIAVSLFAHYSSTHTFHITDDGQAFADKNLADSHALFLDKKEPVVIEVTREEAEAFDAGSEDTGSVDTGSEEKAASEKEEKAKAPAKKAAPLKKA